MSTSSLPEALTSLGPIDFTAVPTDGVPLKAFLEEHLAAAHVLVESVPPPQEPSTPIGNPSMTSSAVLPSSSPSSSAASSLHSSWGKPVKISPKENPLNIPVYKLAAHDGRGAWFARRSVHAGLSFERWSEAIRREFPTSLAVQGAPGEGNVRGIGADKRLEREVVEGSGWFDVYKLSAQFPGPTTPREFVELLIVSDSPRDQKLGSGDVGRQLMVISKPCAHAGAEPASGFIRGAYESVEFIRELPTAHKSSRSAGDLHGLGRHHADARELKHTVSSPSRSGFATDAPIEWIHVSRSDPGGSVPRFMVERGTPGSMVADAKKFVDWACTIDLDAAPPSAADPKKKKDDGTRDAAPTDEDTRAASTEEAVVKDTPPPQEESDRKKEAPGASAHVPGGWEGGSAAAATSTSVPPEESLFSSLQHATSSVAHAAWTQLGTYAPGLGFGGGETERRRSIVPAPLPDRRYSSSSSSGSIGGALASRLTDSEDSADSDSDAGSFASATAGSPRASSTDGRTTTTTTGSTNEGGAEKAEAAREAALVAQHEAKLAALAAELAAAQEKHAGDAKKADRAVAAHARGVEKAEAAHRKALAGLASERDKAAARAAKAEAAASQKAQKAEQRTAAAARKQAAKEQERAARALQRARDRDAKDARTALRQELAAARADLARARADNDHLADALRHVQAENTALVARLHLLPGGPAVVDEIRRAAAAGGSVGPAAAAEREGSVRSTTSAGAKSAKSGKSASASLGAAAHDAGEAPVRPSFHGPGE